MPLLSVAIITLNEEANLARTLASVRFADEIIVVDSGSTDRTLENFAISQCSGTWILSLDADEELSPELQLQIQTLLPTRPPVDAYYLKRRNLFLNRWIKRGGFYPDPKLRLFRKTVANFAHTPMFEDRPVHETITFDGASDTMDFDIIHHAYPTLSTYIEHMDRYSNIGAARLAARGNFGRSAIGFFFGAFLVPQVQFLWTYFILFGFLDGREGLLLHLYHATYVSWKYTKTWERARQLPPSADAESPAGQTSAAA
jgi:glycosyltransferase involved in cell wall biosynthesis